MDDTIPRVVYLTILIAAVGAWVLVEYRGRMGQMLRAVAAWGLIFIGVAAGYGLWDDLRTDLAPRQTVVAETGRVEIPRAPDGHYYLTLTVRDTPVRFMVDTGASTVVLSDRDSERLGIDRSKLAFTGSARTANGTIRTARVTLDNVALDGIPQGRLPAWVGDGPLDVSLLGMDYLSRFAKVEITGDRLVLHR